MLTTSTADFDDDVSSADEETHTHVNKEVEDAEKEGDKYPMGRPNSFLNRMISHGNEKTEKQLAKDRAEAEAREKAKRDGMDAGQAPGAGRSNLATTHDVTTTGAGAGYEGGSTGGYSTGQMPTR